MSIDTEIKFCGMKRAEDVEMACQLGVNALGFIFFPKSKRAIDIETAIKISQNVPSSIARYAVVVNPSPQWLKQMLKDFQPTVIQFHGDETPEFCQQFGYPYIKAIAATSTKSIIDASHRYSLAKAILIDTPAQENYGGTGQSFDWQVVPNKTSKPVILAGGLTVENVLEAIKQVNPKMVDCCSGVESAPGIKDETLMRQFIKQVRGE
ncbi:phosphoribosylanthranilate isomerase [Legionella sp. W05-934-2]|uniref:phosphoribosylanthranilate isomerase n=1 Tax=Legionella sp. W05-934-2 TaxID=1198649 RepID=UPI003462DB6B